MSDLKISAKALFDISELVAGAQAARQALAGLGAAGAQAGQQAAGGLDNAGAEAAQAGQQMSGAGQAARSAGQQMQQAGAEAAAAGQRMGGAGRDAAQAGQQMRQAGAEAAQAGQQMGGAAQGAAGGFSALRLGIAAIVGSELVQWAQQAGAALIAAQINAERLQTTLTFAAGAGAVGQELAWIADMANRLGLEFNSTAQAYASWAAATRNTVISGGEAKKVFEAVAQAGSVMSLSAERQRDVMLALTQIMAKGKVGAEEVRQQLGEHLPIALEAFAAAMGVSTAEFNKMLDAGEVSVDVIPKWAAELKKMTAAAGEMGQSTEASMNRASNAWTALKTAIADSGGASAIVAATNLVADGFANMAMRISTAKALGLGAWGQFLAAMNAPGASVNAQDVDLKKTAGQNALALLVNKQKQLRDNLYSWSPSQTLAQKKSELDQIDADVNRLRNADRVASRAAASRSVQEAAANARRATDDAVSRANKFIEGEDAKNLTAAEQKNKKIKDIQDDLKKATAGLDKNSKEYAAAVAAADRRIADVRKNADKKSTGSGLTAPDRALADLTARVEAEKTLGEQLAKTGLAHEKLNEGEKLAIKYRQELAVATKTVKKEELERLAKKADELGVQQRQNTATKEVLALNQEFSKSAAQRALDLQSINEESAKEVEWLGLSTEARAVAQAQWELEKQTRREILALQEKMAAAASDEGRAVIAAEIERVRAAASEKSMVVAAATATKTAVSEAQRMSQDIERALTDSLLKSFENGKAGIKSLRDYVTNAVKGWAVKILLQPVMAPINAMMQQLSVAMSGAMSGQAAGGLQNLSLSNLIGDKALGGIGSLQLGDVMGSLYPSSALQSLAESTVGGWMGLSSATGGLTQAGADLVAGSSKLIDAAGSIGSWVSVGVDAFNSIKTGEGWGKTAGSAIGTYILPGIGTAVGSMLGGLADSAFGHKGGPKSGGNANAAYDAAGNVVAREMFGGYSPSEMDSTFRTAIDSIQSQYSSLITALGGKKSALTINLGGDSDPKGKAGNRISAQIALGNVGVGAANGGDAERALWGASLYSKVSAGTGDLQQAIQEESARMLVAALRASDLPKEIASAFDGVDLYSASKEQVDSLIKVAQGIAATVSAFKSFGTVLPQLTGMGYSAQKALVDLAGGIDAFTSRLASYRDSYYSTAEKENFVRKQVADELAKFNIAMPQTRDEFRKLVETTDQTTAAGAEVFNALMSVNQAFASVTKSAEELAKALRDEFSSAASEAQKTLGNLQAAQKGRLESDAWLANAAGNKTQWSDNRRAELWALFDGGSVGAEQQLQLLQELQGLIQERYQAEISAVLELTQNAQRLRDAARSIRDYVQSLKTGELSPYTMGERLAESASQFLITVAQARAGDKTALDNVQGKASTYLQLGQDYYGSSAGYAGPGGIFENVVSTLESLGISLDGMAGGQDAAALAAQAQAQYSQAALAEMQRLRSGFDSVAGVLKTQLDRQASAAKSILDRMTGPEQLAALQALPAELAAIIRSAVGTQSAGQSVVQGWYSQNLGRVGEQSGVDYWTSQIGRVGQASAYQAFSTQADIERNVIGIYQSVLGRAPDSAGARYWQEQVSGGMSYETLRALIAASAEAKSRLPQFAVGAERLPSDMIAQLHKDEAVIPAWANTRMLDAVERGAGAPAGGGDLAGLRAEVQQLREVTERQALMIERLLSALGKAVLDSSADNADRIVDGVAAAGQIDNWRAGARRPALA